MQYFSVNKSNQRQLHTQKMSTAINEHIFQVRSHNTPEKSQNSESTVISSKLQPHHDKQNISNQNGDEDPFDEETNKKKNENKQKYRRLKQKLASLCCQHQQKSLFKSNKQVSSSNKSRLLTLAIQFEKMTLNQTKDYIAIQTKLEGILKILDLKLECDLSILKQSRFISAFSALLKKVPAFHKNQFFQSVKTIQYGLKILRIFNSVSANRDYMIQTNQLSTLNSCLNSFIGKQQKKLAIQCLNVLLELLCSKNKADSQQIINISLQIVFFGQLARKLRQALDTCILQQGTIQEQYVIKCLKYLYILYRKSFEKYLQRPLYQQPEIPQIMQFHLDALMSQIQHILPILLLDKEQGCLKEQQLPICIINITLYILKLINLCLHASYKSGQKIFEISQKSPFWQAIQHLYQYSKDSIQSSQENHELQSIYSQIIDFLGKICCQCEQNRKSLAITGILQMFYNHPIVYIMDHKLKSFLIPSLCAVMDKSEYNMKKYLSQNSADNIINYIMSQKKRYEETHMKYIEDQCLKEMSNFNKQEFDQQDIVRSRNLTRKQSVSSLNSYTTQCTQNSYLPINEEDRCHTGLFFLVPFNRWQQLIELLKQLDS